MLIRFLAVILAGLCAVTAGRADERSAERVEFNRDIRPLLAERCYRCHGPDAHHRQADLRLDTASGSQADLGGRCAVVPGRPDDSELLLRVASPDDAERMPPRSAGQPLTPAELALLRRWIEQGAEYQPHWSFVPPRRPAVPDVRDAAWPRNDVDRFLLARLEQEGIVPSPEADRITLLRRVSFDLTGLPPTPADVEAFVADSDPRAYERVVDRLLASPHYGERMAMHWLDLVRYADTVGYHGDQVHPTTPYRDWVIKAFMDNLPFDQFTITQLAGDLLPDATENQKIASGYNRLLQTSHEGGVQVKEYLHKYDADRARNLGAVWMGATLGCVECHDHKFDPYTQRDFYSLVAFFADVDDLRTFKGGDTNPTKREPELLVLSPFDRARIERLAAQVRELEGEQGAGDREKAAGDRGQEAGEGEPRTEGRGHMRESKDESPPVRSTECPPLRKGGPGGVGGREDATPNIELSTSNVEVVDVADTRERLAALKKEIEALEQRKQRQMVTEAIAPKTVRVLARGDWMDESGEIVEPAIPAFLGNFGREGRRATRLDLARWLVSGEHPQTARVFVNRLWSQFFGHGLCDTLEDTGAQGEWPTHPELLDWLAVEFARPGNCGVRIGDCGLSETATTTSNPQSAIANPQSKNACQAWDVRHIVRLIVTSAAYRQSSRERADLAERDPHNRLCARQTASRLPAEMVRDNALAVSGLLVDRLGGPSSHPYQPAGYYKHLNFPTREYQADADDNQYRRGVYMHWQRQYLHPMLKAFDAPSREECTARRPISNTPLAALVLLNDPTFLEAARALAIRGVREGGAADAGRVRWLWRTALSREPATEESALLLRLLAEERAAWRDSPESATKLLSVGLSKPPADIDPAELAAWAAVARALLNLHETITKY